MKKRVVIAGMGDTGLLVAIHLARDFDVVGITPKACLVSGQELGARLTRPEEWKRDFRVPFARYRRLDEVRIEQGLVSHVDLRERRVSVTHRDGTQRVEPYDYLVIALGVRNGFWREPSFESEREIDGAIAESAARVAAARRVAIVGGGATGVSVSGNLAERFPEKEVHLFYGRDRLLPGYHPRTRSRIESRLQELGVHLHPGHRALVSEGFPCDTPTTSPLRWTTGQPDFAADLTLWAVGRTRPNSDALPKELLDADGFVAVDDTLRVPSHPEIFAVGDIAASDPHRSSARNWGHRIVAHNLRACANGRRAQLKHFRPPPHRWGSILGVERAGMRVFQPNGSSLRVPVWWVEKVLFPFVVRRGIYKGLRPPAQR